MGSEKQGGRRKREREDGRADGPIEQSRGTHRQSSCDVTSPPSPRELDKSPTEIVSNPPSLKSVLRPSVSLPASLPVLAARSEHA